jgi:phenylpyruvate tautomerase PptA (4-oxalocrotonate tautomerase family)
MPHVIVKLHPGRSEDQKMQLAEAITRKVMEIAQCEEKTVSVAFEEVEPADWPEKVYRPDILENEARLYKKPGYNPFETGDPRSLREAYQQRLAAQYEEWKPEIDRLKAKAEKAAADAKVEYNKLIEDLQARQKTARAKMEELRQASGGAWEELKTGIEGAWNEMEKAVKAAVSRFK